MRPTSSEKLDQLIGEVRGLRLLIGEQGNSLDKLSERMSVVETATTQTSEVLQAWTTVKTGLKWWKGGLAILATIVGIYATVKGLFR